MKTIYTRSLNGSPSLSIFDPEYPEELLQIYNPPVLLFLPRRFGAVNQTEDCSRWSSETTREGVRSVEKIIKELGK